MWMNRRTFAMTGGMLAVAAAAPRSVRAAGRAPSAADDMSFVDVELRASARSMIEMMRTLPPPSAGTLPALRAGGEKFAAPRLADVNVDERLAPAGKGNPNVGLFVINAQKGGDRPAILHTHGGGYIAGRARNEVGSLQKLAKTLDCVIVSVEYRLAPETRYTGSIEDTYAGLKWLHAEAAALGVDRDRIALLGESAGGGHAARLAITARDRAEVPVAAQILIYPMLDDRTGSTVKMPGRIGTLGWNAEANVFGWRSFLGMAPGGAGVPSAGVPARVRNLAGLPPAFIGVGGIDLFVSEDVDYARRLNEAGVPTELLVVPGAYHGFDIIAADTTPAQRFTKAKLNALRRAFGQKVEL